MSKTPRQVFDEYNANVARDRAGYDYKGFMVREIQQGISGVSLWVITHDGFHIASCTDREDAHDSIDLLT